jgi:hypothetical protein
LEGLNYGRAFDTICKTEDAGSDSRWASVAYPIFTPAFDAILAQIPALVIIERKNVAVSDSMVEDRLGASE